MRNLLGMLNERDLTQYYTNNITYFPPRFLVWFKSVHLLLRNKSGRICSYTNISQGHLSWNLKTQYSINTWQNKKLDDVWNHKLHCLSLPLLKSLSKWYRVGQPTGLWWVNVIAFLWGCWPRFIFFTTCSLTVGANTHKPVDQQNTSTANIYIQISKDKRKKQS